MRSRQVFIVSIVLKNIAKMHLFWEEFGFILLRIFVRRDLKTDLLSPYKIQSMKGRFALAVVTWMAYSAAFFPAFLKIGDAAGMLVTLPVMASAWLFGLTGGLLAAVLNILITALLFDVVGVHGFDAMIQRWPGIFAGFLIGAVTGWMSDLFYKVRRQSSELVIERDTLQKEIAERQRAEESLQLSLIHI